MLSIECVALIHHVNVSQLKGTGAVGVDGGELFGAGAKVWSGLGLQPLHLARTAGPGPAAQN